VVMNIHRRTDLWGPDGWCHTSLIDIDVHHNVHNLQL
jgi:hypothetical protein